VALFFALVRGIEDDRITELMQSCMGDVAMSDMAGIVADLFVMTMQTRDCRGGKGERKVFYKMLMFLNKQFPTTVLQVLTLLGEYGYYKDFFQLLEMTADRKEDCKIFRSRIVDIVANQLIEDEAILDSNGAGSKAASISMCAKYCPREGKHFAKNVNADTFSELVGKLYPEEQQGPGARKQGKKQYRQLLAKLTKVLDVPEVKMCGKRFSELDFAKVPSVCTKKFCKAFLNEKVKGAVGASEQETGNRHPDDEDRILCRQNLRKAVVDQKVKGKQLYPHDIVKTLYEGHGRVSTVEKEVYNAQWSDLRASVQAQLTAITAAAAAAAGSQEGGGGAVAAAPAINLGKLVPLSDVSGSMAGDPMLVSIALGILVSEVNHPAFRDRVLTFDSTPSWVNLAPCGSIADKVQVLRHAPWGGSTDISKAFKLVCEVVRAQRLPAEEVPDMIIFSDMQFDQAAGRGGSTQTQLEQVRKMFHDVGIEVSGSPYPAPKIIFWNLRSGTVGFPAQAADENVQMLSGFSPSLLKFVLEGAPVEMEEVEVVDAAGEVQLVQVAKSKPTPYDTLRKVLDDERYDPVRALLSRSTEGVLAEYCHVPVEKAQKQQQQKRGEKGEKMGE
jgi:hypothetical protein